MLNFDISFFIFQFLFLSLLVELLLLQQFLAFSFFIKYRLFEISILVLDLIHVNDLELLHPHALDFQFQCGDPEVRLGKFR